LTQSCLTPLRQLTQSCLTPLRHSVTFGSLNASPAGAPLCHVTDPAAGGRLHTLTVPPDGKTLATVTEGGVLKLWDVESLISPGDEGR
jgi:WD40 repeat protein